MPIRVKEIAFVAMFAALAVAGGYLFLAVPNVEVFTAIVFISGVILGSFRGLLVGLIAQSIFSTFNPVGISPLPLFVAQVLHRLLVGYWGGYCRLSFESQNRFSATVVKLGAAGLVLTLLYDLMTDFSFFFVSGFSFQQMKTTLTLGLPFYLIHAVVNTAIFAIAVPLLLRGLTRTGLYNPVEIN